MTTRAELHEAIDKLTDDQLKKVIDTVRALVETDPREILKNAPGIRVPKHWPPQFQPFEPIQISWEGELPSEQLIRERR